MDYRALLYRVAVQAGPWTELRTMDWTGLGWTGLGWTGLDSDNDGTEGECLSGYPHLCLMLLPVEMSFLEVKGHMYIIKYGFQPRQTNK